ncbi:unnamed protein product [Colias eurytheme]|nr:unnamed protein product [Colias eurytheme]
MSIDVLINHEGIVEKFDLPSNMNDIEKELLDDALTHLTKNVKQAMMWYEDTVCAEIASGKVAAKTHFMYKKTYSHVEDCYHQIL